MLKRLGWLLPWLGLLFLVAFLFAFVIIAGEPVPDPRP